MAYFVFGILYLVHLKDHCLSDSKSICCKNDFY